MHVSDFSFDLTHDGLVHVNTSAAGLIAAGVPAAVVLDLIKDRLKGAVDAQAEALRLTLITPGSGQAMEYQEAYSQAVAAIQAPDTATAARYPMLAVTVGTDVDPTTRAPAVDVLGVARSVVVAYDAYILAGASIRGIRLRGKATIDAAASAEAAEAAFAAIEWTLTA